ncbi:SGNH/GDSL hydrolase family protein [Hymenobacter caeli]|uniref:Lysophospholipase L1-like esterase n=1 Tax=Hymenobacter caeli TaxID=2735894 RepID=A0ABX2FNV1_9BACT|nr:hypothetical protein [Hymenobacter caeli]NRT18818.1 lysophospholipase L1-like esterase [Hymenobacter caeli]
MNSVFKHSVPALGLLGLALGGCQPNIDAPQISAGSATFTTYLAVGNSLTSGYADGGLYLDGQLNSYPNILSQQFAQVGGGAFTQPLFTPAQSNGSGYLKLTGFTAAGKPITANVTTNLAIRGVSSANGQYLYTKYTDPVNNLGVPGIRLADIQTVGYGSVAGNAFFERITPDASAGQTYLQRVQATVGALKPTFFTEWLGSNDVLLYATAGGGSPSPTAAITSTATFTANLGLVLDALTTGGAKGVVSTIPDVTGIPFFTTVGPSFRATLAAANVPTAAPFVYTTGILAPGQPNTRVAGTLADIRTGGVGTLLLTLTSSDYAGLYGQPTGKYWRDYYRQLKPSLPATVPNLSVFLLAMGVDTTKAFGQSTGNPFPSILVLDGTEQANVATATNAYNGIISSAAVTRGLALFDANTYFRGVATGGQAANAVNNTASYVSGNIFGLDGVHPTPRGYALVANEILRAINAKYGSTFQDVNVNNYRGVVFP